MAMMTRRMVLATGGATAIISVGAGAMAWWPGTASAIQPWKNAGQSFGDVRLDALAYAILAPNPHNRQPWQFRLVGKDQIDIFCDLERRLPHTDPFDRQISVGFGCMIELLEMAALAKGWTADISLWPEGEPQPRLDSRRVAEIRFVANPAGPVDPLFDKVLERRSTKTVYDNRPVTPATLANLLMPSVENAVVAGGSVDPAMIAELRALTWDAWMVEYQDAKMRRESVDLMRIGNAEVAANPDGIELGGIGLGLAKMAGIVTREKLDTPGTTAFQQGIDMYQPMLQLAQGHVWLITPDNSRALQIAAGRRWVRMNLKAQAMGLAFHPISQALQEVKAMAKPYAAIHQRLGATNGAVVQMLGRIGYAQFPEPTPRWPLQSRILAA